MGEDIAAGVMRVRAVAWDRLGGQGLPCMGRSKEPGSGQFGMKLSRAWWARNFQLRLPGLSSLHGEGGKVLFPRLGMGDGTAWHHPQPWM